MALTPTTPLPYPNPPTVGVSPSGVSNVTQPVQIQQRTLNEFYPRPPLAMEDPVLAEQIREFQTMLVRHLIAKRENAQAIRDPKGEFLARYERNKRWARAQLEPQMDREGNIDPAGPDGHACMGITQGWGLQSLNDIDTYMGTNLLSRWKRPFEVETAGQKDDSDTLKRLALCCVDDNLRSGRFASVAPYWLRSAPTHGAGFLRYRLRWRRRFGKSDDGVWRESFEDLVPVFTVYRPIHVAFTDPNLPTPLDQEGVFWTSPCVTLNDLEQEEVVLNPDGSYEGGRFRNLDSIREVMAQNRYNTLGTPTGTDEDVRRTSSLPTFTMLEYEGALPIYQWVMQGLFTPDIAAWYMVDTGDWPQATEDGTYDVSSLDQWGRKMAQITMWNVTFLSDYATAGMNRMSLGHIIEMEPAKCRSPRNSMFAVVFMPDELNLEGRSVFDLGEANLKEGDSLFNSKIFNAEINSDPPAIYDERAIQDGTLEDAKRAFRTKGRSYSARPQGRPAQDLATFLHRPDDPSLWTAIANLKAEYKLTVAASALAMGTDPAGGTGTLGEVKINEDKAGSVLAQITRRAGTEMSRLFQAVWEDNIYYRGDGLADYLAQISGIGNTEIQQALPSLVGLENEVRIIHPLNMIADVAVQTSLMIQVANAFPGVFDLQKIAVATMRNVYPNAEDLLTQKQQMLPQDEEGQMSEGNWIQPSSDENFQAHIVTHTGTMLGLQQRLKNGTATDQDHVLAQQLPDHLEITQSMAQAAAQLAGQMQPKGATPPKKQENPSEVQAPGGRAMPSEEMSSDVHNQANGTPATGSQAQA
jgi:hypothetical protein